MPESFFGAPGGTLDFALSESQWSLLARYVQLVLSWRSRLNLTGPASAADAAKVLVLEALACVWYLPDAGTIVDVGSGAGTPGVPVAVARPAARVLLVEASQKKAGFLGVVLRELGLSNANVLHARAETLGRDPAHRERYDAAVARAVATLPVIAELVLPLVRIGGVAVLPRGPQVPREAAAAAGVLGRLGGAGTCCRGGIVVVRKVAATPAAYPRRTGVPERHPLRVASIPAGTPYPGAGGT